MHALAFVTPLYILVGICLARPSHTSKDRSLLEKRVLQEVIEVEDIIEVWKTVTVNGAAPSGWRAGDTDNTDHTPTEKTISTWMTTIPGAKASDSPGLGPDTEDIELSGEGVTENDTLNGVDPGNTSDSNVESTQIAESSSSSYTSISEEPTKSSQDEGASTPTSLSATSISPTASLSVPRSQEYEGSAGASAPLSASLTASVSTVPMPSTTASFSQPSASSTGGNYPFSALIAFGDNLSDNGNGSAAHHVADRNDPNNMIYGSGTWTNAQVAVSYLTDLLGVPMTQNHAFGHAWGGADMGASLANTMFISDFHDATVSAELGYPGAPPVSGQVATYISQGVNKDALHFVWGANNDADLKGFYFQDEFNKNLTSGVTKIVQQLLDAGAPYIFVPNIYPKQYAPVVPKYFGLTTPSQQDDFGTFINNANAALKTALAGMNTDKVIYYDANTFLTQVWKNAASYGITNAKDTNGWPAFCDGDPDKTSDVQAAIAAGTLKENDNWGMCVLEGKQDEWFWMQYVDMTSRVHELLAGDMNKALAAHFGH